MLQNKLPLTIAVLAYAALANYASASDGSANLTERRDIFKVSGLCRGFYLPTEESLGKKETSATAGFVKYDGNNSVVLSEDVFLNNNKLQVKTQHLIFNKSENTGEVFGNVEILTPTTKIFGKSSTINFSSGAFNMTDSTFQQLNSNLRGKGRRFEYKSDSNIVIENSSITTCQPKNNDWELSGSTVELNSKTNRGWASNVVFKIRDQPVFYFPFVGFPIGSSRLTGLLPPSITSSKSNGVSLATPFYFNLHPQTDLILRPKTFENRGKALGIENRYLLSGGSKLNIHAEYLARDNLTKKNRYGSKVLFKNPSSNRFNWEFKIQDSSDQFFKSDLGNFSRLDSNTNLYSFLKTKIKGGKWEIDGLAEHIRFPEADRDSKLFSRVPEIKFSGVSYNNNKITQLDSTFTNFKKKSVIADGEDGKRAAVNISISKKKLFKKFQNTNRILGFFRKVNLRNNTDLNTEPIQAVGFTSDNIVRIGIEDFSGGNQLWTTRGKFTLIRPKSTTNHLPAIFDTSLAELNFVEDLFKDNRFSGNDLVGDTLHLTWSNQLSGLVPFTKANYQLIGGRTFFFKDRYISLSRKSETNNLSPFIFQLNVKAKNGGHFFSDYKSKPSGIIMDTLKFGFRFQKTPKNYLVNRFVWKKDSETGISKLQNIGLFASKDLSSRWSILAGLNVNPSLERRNGQVLGIEYRSCCWKFALAHSYNFAGENISKAQIEFTGFGEDQNKNNRLIDKLTENYEYKEYPI